MDENVIEIEKHVVSLPTIIKLQEHKAFDKEYVKIIQELNIPFCQTEYEKAPKYLGIHPETLRASYYIGVDWLTDKHAIAVTPKLPHLDFIEMFVCALKFEPAAKYFSKFYCIDFNKKPVTTDVLNSQITPLIIIHYIALLKGLTKRGLKKGYVIKEENLKSKIKGKVKISQNLRINTLNKREDRVFCQYQEYTIDNPENRILKKALSFAKSYLKTLSAHSSYKMIVSSVNGVSVAFNDVSDQVELSELKKITYNKLYKEYSEALRVAKMILHRFNYSISETTVVRNTTPTFWIDMSRLYEVYVYSKLYEAYGDTIQFQVAGRCRTAVDFVKKDECLIIDTKYKPQYNDGCKGIIEDIRQISGYARDLKVLDTLNADAEEIPSCLIIYPEKVLINEDENETVDECHEINSFVKYDRLVPNASPITGFTKFYKISVPLPVNQ